MSHLGAGTRPQFAQSLAIVMMWLATGCLNTVRPPLIVRDPLTVHLLDHGRHPSLVLPKPDGTLTRYVYGNWTWYALGRTGICEAMGAMLFPTQGALGRRSYASSNIAAVLERDPAEQVWAIQVEHALAQSLQEELDRLFEASRHTLHYNAAYDLDFVHHPAPYVGCHNCNHVMAEWLRKLGCNVDGSACFSEWKVIDGQRRGRSLCRPVTINNQ